MAVLVAAMMIMATMVPTWALGTDYDNRVTSVSITITRADSWDATADEDTMMRTFQYVKVFDAVYDTVDGGATATATNSETTETSRINPTQAPENKKISYTIPADSTWHTVLLNAGNLWFDQTLSADQSRYVITWKTGVGAPEENSTNAQLAAKWLWDNKGSATVGTLDEKADHSGWTKTGLAPGYYLIKSNNTGERLVAATGDITLYEKNTYPTLAKTEQDVQDGASFVAGPVKVQIGNTINYRVVVYVPTDANKDIVVTDVMSDGLKKVTSFDVTVKTSDTLEGTYSALEAGTSPVNYVKNLTKSDQSWEITLKPLTSGSTEYEKVYNSNVRGKFFEFTYSAIVDDDAAGDDLQKKNTVTMTYDTYELSRSTAFEIWATAIEKYDASKAEVDDETGRVGLKTGVTGDYLLANAKFKLQRRKVGDTGAYADVNVILDGTFYRPALSTETSATAMKTNSDGQIIIRGLDQEYTYQLIETEAPVGYNLASDAVSLTLEKDTLANVEYNATTTEDTSDTVRLEVATVAKVGNNPGKALPSTGGMGTTVLYIVGGMLVILAGAYLFFSRKKVA